MNGKITLFVTIIVMSFIGCKKEDEKLREHLINNTWSYSGSECSQYFGWAQFNDDQTGDISAAGCNNGECGFVAEFDWRVTEEGVLTIIYSHDGGGTVNNCGIEERASDQLTITTETVLLQLNGLAYTKRE